MMKHSILTLIRLTALFMAMGMSTSALAVGTAATSAISNTATVNYTASGAPLSASDTVVFNVHELIELTTTWQDAANVSVTSPDSDQVLTYLLVNTGNGVETFSLSVFNGDLTDQFDPTNARIYLDNGNNTWDGIATETLYQPGINDPVLDANGADRITVFVLNDIPGALSNGDLGNSRLDAQSTTAGAAGAAVGTVLATLGDGGTIDAIVGASQAQSNTTGTYVVAPAAAVTVTLTKSSSVIANLEGCVIAPCAPNPGATIRYSIVVTVAGTGDAETLSITDPLPADTTYVPGSITLDAVAKTDVVDADEADITAGTITLNLGNVTAPATRTITFDVTIN
jgi:uncharacterized repeat protein (TIGR01451 family)